MKQFKDFGITADVKAFVGDKIKIERILNREIIVHEFKIEISKFQEKGNGKCLYLQIEINEIMYVIFTGSGVLMNMLERTPRDSFPFTATIIKQNDHFELK
jgi:hypothetical protein